MAENTSQFEALLSEANNSIIASPKPPNEKALNIFSPEELFVWEEEYRSGDVADFNLFDTGEFNTIEDPRYGTYKLISINPRPILKESGKKYLLTLSILYKQQVIQNLVSGDPSLKQVLYDIDLEAIFKYRIVSYAFVLTMNDDYGYDISFDVVKLRTQALRSQMERLNGANINLARLLYGVINYSMCLMEGMKYSSYGSYQNYPNYIHFIFDNVSIQLAWLNRIFDGSGISFMDLFNPLVVYQWECDSFGIQASLQEIDSVIESYFEEMVRNPSPFDIVWSGNPVVELLPRQRMVQRRKQISIPWSKIWNIQGIYPNI